MKKSIILIILILFSIISFSQRVFENKYIVIHRSWGDYVVNARGGKVSISDTINGVAVPMTDGDTVIYCTSVTGLTPISTFTRTPGTEAIFALKRNTEFSGTITISDDSLKFCSYGTSGAKPTITGFTTISGWTNEGGGIYSKAITADSKINMVTVNGVNTGMGRYPNSGASYLTYESHSTNTSITDNQLTGTPNWTGATLVMRNSDFRWRVVTITNHVTTTLSYTTSSTETPNDGNGYFIQDDIRTLDSFGEWFHNDTTDILYMFFGAEDPTNYTVKAATKENLLVTDNNSYITVQNLNFTGSNGNTIDNSTQSDNFIVQNCEVSFSGGSGAYINSENSLLDNNMLSDCTDNGIYGASSLITITNNTIDRTSLIIGASTAPDGAIASYYNDNGLIQYNEVDSAGAHGIRVNGLNLEVRNNFVNHSVLVHNDKAGIYVNGTVHESHGMIVDGNIVLNAFGYVTGAETPSQIPFGILLDYESTGVTVTNNTSAYNQFAGIQMNDADSNRIENNLCFSNRSYQFQAQNTKTAVDNMFADTVRYNQFIATGTQRAGRYYEANTAYTPSHIGIVDSNYYARPTDDDNTIEYSYAGAGTQTKTLLQWQAYSGLDTNSKYSSQPSASDDSLMFIYNPNKTDSITTLDHAMIDIEGNVYSDSITLEPFTSVILLPYNYKSIKDNLYAYYSLEGLIDSVDSNPITTNSNVTFSTGYIGNGAAYDVNTDYLRNAWATPPTDSLFTIIFNFKLSSLASTLGRNVFLAGSYNSGSVHHWRLYINSTNGVVFTLYNTANTGKSTITANSLIDQVDKWYTLIITPANEAGDISRIYINGAKPAYNTQTVWAGVHRTPNLYLTIGNDPSSGTSATIGMIDEFGWYTGLMNLTQMGLYNRTTTGYPYFE